MKLRPVHRLLGLARRLGAGLAPRLQRLWTISCRPHRTSPRFRAAYRGRDVTLPSAFRGQPKRPLAALCRKSGRRFRAFLMRLRAHWLRFPPETKHFADDFQQKTGRKSRRFLPRIGTFQGVALTFPSGAPQLMTEWQPQDGVKKAARIAAQPSQLRRRLRRFRAFGGSRIDDDGASYPESRKIGSNCCIIRIIGINSSSGMAFIFRAPIAPPSSEAPATGRLAAKVGAGAGSPDESTEFTAPPTPS